NDWHKHVGAGAIVDPNNELGGSIRSGAVTEPVNNALTSRSGVFINSKWQFNVSGSVQLPLGLLLSTNFFGRQGFVVPYWVRVRPHDTRGDIVRIQIGNVDDYRLPSAYTLDLHLEKLFRIGKAITITPSVDCFNAANAHTVLQRVGLVG